jgi:ABC-type glycerol-3-phosphate transport system permease component
MKKWHSLGYVPLVLIGVLTLTPLFFLLTSSLKSNTEISQFPPTLLPQHLEWRNYVDIFHRFPFWRCLLNTLILATGQVMGSLIVCSLAAWGFARYPGRWNNLIFSILLGTMMIPGQITAIPVFAMFVKLGLYNTYVPLILPAWLGAGSAFGIFLMRQFFLKIPKDLLDAARIDGASELQVFYIIALPLCRPILWTLAVFNLIGSWNDYFGPLIYLNDEKLYPLSLGLTYFTQASKNAAFGTQWQLIMAASLVTLLPVLVVFIIAQRSFINSIMSSALKE